MQQHYILALATLWIFTLAILPFLFSTARRNAYTNGLADGQKWQKGIRKQLVSQLEQQLADKEAELDNSKKSFTQAMNARRDVIAELEARIMSYTGLAVTKADYNLLTNAAETLDLAEKTWKAAPGTEPWRTRATQQRQDIQALAMRVHAQLRNTPASAANAGETA